jgi:hypothetical protein
MRIAIFCGTIALARGLSVYHPSARDRLLGRAGNVANPSWPVCAGGRGFHARCAESSGVALCYPCASFEADRQSSLMMTDNLEQVAEEDPRRNAERRRPKIALD